jgi:hypothetical protein
MVVLLDDERILPMVSRPLSAYCQFDLDEEGERGTYLVK